MSHIVVEPFAHNLEDLVTPATPLAPVRGPYHYICKLAVLLGRIITYNNSPLPPTSAADFESLETTLARFRLSLPRKYRSIVGLDPRDVIHVTQLNLLLHVCTILLHHPTVPEDETTEQPAFGRCISAVGNILALLKTHINTASEPSAALDALQNPFITSALFLAARVLVVRWLEGRDKGVKAEIELVLAVFERARECWPELAGKYSELVMGDLKKEVTGIKSAAGGYIGKECALGYVGGM